MPGRDRKGLLPGYDLGVSIQHCARPIGPPEMRQTGALLVGILLTYLGPVHRAGGKDMGGDCEACGGRGMIPGRGAEVSKMEGLVSLVPAQVSEC